MNNKKDGLQETDDIDRLFARYDPQPGTAHQEKVKLSLKQLGQQSAFSARPRWRPASVLLASLSLVVLTIVVLLAVVTLQSAGTPAPSTQLASGPVRSNDNTTSPQVAASLPPTTERISSVMTVPSDSSTPVSPNSPVINTTPSGTTSPIAATPDGLPSPNPTSLETIASSSTQTNTIQPGSISGTIAEIDLAANTLKLTTNPTKQTLVLKLNSQTIAIRKGSPVALGDIKVGETLTASGTYNQQGQFEATSLALGILNNGRPLVGDPGYPDEKQ